jgi:glycosyltransferase involved in cell wall biosynthesis
VNVTVAIPVHPPRLADGSMARAVDSVRRQLLAPTATVTALDGHGEGAAVTRNRALAMVDTDWVAFLDSDDELKPHHLRSCARHAALTGADLIYPGFEGDDPTGMFGRSFDPILLHRHNYIPVTVLVRTNLVRKVGGFTPHPDGDGDPCEDWGCWLKLLDAGATFSHLPQRTWIRHPGGTRGRPEEAPSAV